MSKRITFTIMDYSFLLFFIGLIIISFVLNVYNNLNGYGVDKITPINMVNGFFYKDINEAKICKYFADWKKEAC